MHTVAELLALGVNHFLAGRMPEAEQACRQILAVDSNQFGALHLLGVIALQTGQAELAIERFRRAIASDGTQSALYSNLGSALQSQGQLVEAIASFRRALELEPGAAAAHNNLGAALQAQGALPEAVDCYRRAIELRADYVAAHTNLGIALARLGKLDEASAAFCRALDCDANDVVAAFQLGKALHEQGHLDQAIQRFQQVLRLQSGHVRALKSLGSAYAGKGELQNAALCLRQAIELSPADAEAYNSLGTVFQAQGNFEEAVACYRQALDRKPDDAAAHSNLLLALQYREGVTLAELAEAHAEYERLHAARLHERGKRFANNRDPNRRLRLGFVSRDLGQHPVGYFLIRALENLDRGQFELVCYSDRVAHDRLTKRFAAVAAAWRDVRHRGDAELAEIIRGDQIDILFDLAGHTANNRLLVFARQPAPLSVTWAGYVGTTGLKAIDYLLADGYQVPPDAEIHYSERVLRMPDAYVSYEAPPAAPPVAPLPALHRGFVTFGSFNNPSKITPQVVQTWSEILHRAPRSRLVLRYPGMNDVSVAGKLSQQFASHGIGPDRVEFHGWSPHAELLARYSEIDIALDPFPYSGGLTTCEALWMGVPVITCPGETFAGRHAFTFLSTLGLPGLVAPGRPSYVERATTLAADLPRLAALRSCLREQMAASPLCDGPRFAANLARVLRGIWRTWCGPG